MHYVSLTTGNVLDMYKAIAWELGLGVERSRASAHHAIRIEVSRLATEARTTAHPRRRRGTPPAQRCPRRPAPADQLRHGLRQPHVPHPRRPHRAAPPPLNGRARIALPSASSCATTSPASSNGEELDAYLTHRLRLAGCELTLFEPPAVEALFQGARGLPRQINRIAHYALSAAALDNARTVNADHLQHALEELRP